MAAALAFALAAGHLRPAQTSPQTSLHCRVPWSRRGGAHVLQLDEGPAQTTSLLSSDEANAQGIPYAADEATYKRGVLTICAITVMFSSNSPAVHAAFTAVARPPPVLLLNAAVSSTALAGLWLGGPLLDASTTRPATLAKDAPDGMDRLSLRAGIELGTWKMLGTTANLFGLSLTSADHGAFLVQLTTLLVPAAQGLMGVPIPRRIWAAIALALGGVLAFTLDPGSSAGSSAAGDGLCVLAACFYATYDLALFRWGRRVAPLPLIRAKIATQAALSLALLAAAGGSEALAFATSLPASEAPPLLAVVAWSGLVVNAVAPFLQVGGQQATGPARAQIIYASQPLWAALIAWAFLGETVGLEGALGAAAFVSATALAATAPAPDPACDADTCEV